MLSKFHRFKGGFTQKVFGQNSNQTTSYSKKSAFSLRDSFFSIPQRMLQFSNPSIGQNILRLEAPGIFLRVDGRAPSVFHQEGGLRPRVNRERIVEITFQDVIQYQRYNQNPFGWGACKSFDELNQFIANNKTHSASKWIFVFLGNATSLIDLKLDTGIEGDSYDLEAEHLVINHIPFENMLAATCPAYRDKFMEGLLVPNLMHDFHPSLPKVLRKDDLSSCKHLLTWLMKHDAEEVFGLACSHLYQGKSEDTLIRMLDGDKTLIKAIKNALQKEERESTMKL